VRRLIVAALQLLAGIITNFKVWLSNRRAAEKEPYVNLLDDAYKKFVVLILITTIPTGIIGLLLKPMIEKASMSLLVPGICLVITAIILLVSDNGRIGKKKIKRTKYSDAAIIGAAQGVATLPGISRSGTTITACLLLGFDRAFAVQYSFLASIPAILGANLLELKDLDLTLVNGSMVGMYIVGMIVAGVVGYICIKVMIKIVKSKKFSYFAYYCAIVGVLCIAVYFIRG
jgi:undecaprenyl-diphosphatase